MASAPDGTSAPATWKTALGLSLVLALAVAVRLWYFTGLALGDDTLYAAQVIANARGGFWPPAPYHWHTRLGVTVPAALAVRLFGLHPLAFVLWPLAASLGGIVLAYRVGGDCGGPRAAWLAAVLAAAFPLDI